MASTRWRENQLARSWRVLVQRTRSAYREQVDTPQQSLLVAWLAFGVTFSITRGITYWLRGQHGPAGRGIVVRGHHLHHYNLGIALLAAVGATALRGPHRHRRHRLIATAYGSGTALIVDELALLIDLQDVYWAQEGRHSVDAAIGTIAAGGLYLAAAPFWRRVLQHFVRTCVETATGRLPALANQ